MECASRQPKVRYQRLHNLDGSEPRWGWADSTVRRSNLTDQAQHHSGINREAGMDSFLEQLHFWYLWHSQLISGQVRECVEYFEAPVRGGFWLQQEHDYEGARKGSQGAAYQRVCCHFPALPVRHLAGDWKPCFYQTDFDKIVFKNTSDILILDPSRIHFPDWLGREYFEKLNSPAFHEAWGNQAFYRDLLGVLRGWRGITEEDVSGKDMLVLLPIHRTDQERN